MIGMRGLWAIAFHGGQVSSAAESTGFVLDCLGAVALDDVGEQKAAGGGFWR